MASLAIYTGLQICNNTKNFPSAMTFFVLLEYLFLAVVATVSFCDSLQSFALWTEPRKPTFDALIEKVPLQPSSDDLSVNQLQSVDCVKTPIVAHLHRIPVRTYWDRVVYILLFYSKSKSCLPRPMWPFDICHM